METGAIFGTGTMRENPRDPGLYEGRVQIAGYPYLLRGVLRTDHDGTFYELRFYNPPRDTPPAAPT